MKTIIIYATKHGSTEKAVQLLKEQLASEVEIVNVKNVRGVDLEEYDHVILGGPIYMGRLHKKILAYVYNHLDTLLQKRVGLFICAGVEDLFVQEEELEEAFPYELYVHAVVKEVFGYEFDFRKLSAFEKMTLRARGIEGSVSKLSPPVIKQFAHTIEG
ncbi:flavodoxin domain-containing protein [Halobacillus mangrovi]|uniref:Flavodoxin-like domain-containing protein n=1 Tax=Halobacillus mangrovi TaxID=402384 RepID=A0A1W5ZR49_9BACI|nr:flavodoxin domain-containing protein [Halobacillus mangrovi]ARI75737.1 hypothetical protein HM131_02340 [Halobacillus mangrovi]